MPVETVPSLCPPAHQTRNKSSDKAVTFGEFHEAVGEKHAGQSKDPRARSGYGIPGWHRKDAPQQPADSNAEDGSDEDAVEDVPREPLGKPDGWISSLRGDME